MRIGLQFSQVIEIFQTMGQVLRPALLLHLQLIGHQILQIIMSLLVQGQLLRLAVVIQHPIFPAEAQTPEGIGLQTPEENCPQVSLIIKKFQTVLLQMRKKSSGKNKRDESHARRLGSSINSHDDLI